MKPVTPTFHFSRTVCNTGCGTPYTTPTDRRTVPCVEFQGKTDTRFVLTTAIANNKMQIIDPMNVVRSTTLSGLSPITSYHVDH